MEWNPCRRDEMIGMRVNPCRRVTAVLVMFAFPAVAVAEGPSASFSVSPENPRSGDDMFFASSSCDPDGRLVSEAWDLDGDGAYDDAAGHAASTTFTAAGSHFVGLQVTSADGATAVQRRTVMVDTVYALPRPDSARALAPFPVVTLAGRLTPTGARIKLLRVTAPVCSRIRVTCRGRGCPRRGVSMHAGRKASRIRPFERSLRAGSVVTVRVSKGDRIGKLTTFRIRLHNEPARRDMCLKPGDSKGSRCPRS
jgi:PKD repeat protein